jgi:hypothetical protein
MKDSFGRIGYRGPSAEATDAERAGMAALVLVVNLCRELRAQGVYSAEAFDMNFVNATGVSSPRLGTNLEQILYGNLKPESRDSQDRNRGLQADETKARITGLRREYYARVGANDKNWEAVRALEQEADELEASLGSWY